VDEPFQRFVEERSEARSRLCGKSWSESAEALNTVDAWLMHLESLSFAFALAAAQAICLGPSFGEMV
jgi:hypothetical protein